jgi:hypothetical protein
LLKEIVRDKKEYVGEEFVTGGILVYVASSFSIFFPFKPYNMVLGL